MAIIDGMKALSDRANYTLARFIFNHAQLLTNFLDRSFQIDDLTFRLSSYRSTLPQHDQLR
jgi:hypothetical protein